MILPRHQKPRIVVGMAIFSASDVIIAVTLVVNALALMSSKLPRLHQHHRSIASTHDAEEKIHDDNQSCGISFAEETVSLLNGGNISLDNHNQEDDIDNYSGASLMVRVRMLVFGIRKFSCVIVIWNALFFILMVFVFGS